MAARKVFEHLEKTGYKVVSQYGDEEPGKNTGNDDAIAKVIAQSRLAKDGYKVSVVKSSKFASTICCAEESPLRWTLRQL